MKNDTYCPIPFYHAFVKPNNKCGVCCAFQGKHHKKETGYDTDVHINDVPNISDYLKSEPLKHIQEQMLAGEKVPGCTVCYQREELGYQSVRTKELLRGIPDFEISTDDPKLEFLEITFGNYCNLACRVCGPSLSTSWWEESNMLHDTTKWGNYFPKFDIKKTNVTRDFDIPDFKDLKLIKITGGEPMLHPKFYDFIGKMEQSQVHCEIFTNVSHVPKQRLLDSLLKFKYVKLFLSIDDIGSGQEYTRHNAKWDVTEKSTIAWLNWIKENKEKTFVYIAPTFNIYNAETFDRLIDWWLDISNDVLGELAATHMSSVPNNITNMPEWLSMSLHRRPDDIKRKVYNYIKKLQKSDLYGAKEMAKTVDGFINYLDNCVKLPYSCKERDEFVEITHQLDSNRSQSIKEVYPNLYEDFKTEFDNCDK